LELGGATVVEQFDAVVVGARCAGAPLAALLARRGLDVALVEQATFPRDTLSTHVYETDGIEFLGRLGVIGSLLDTGAPFINRVDVRAGDFRVAIDWPRRPGDRGGVMSVRRFLLDPILVDAAEQAGADVRMSTKVTGVVREEGRVAGVRVTEDGRESELRARLVVGADGRNSTVAGLVGSRKYNLTPNRRAFYWSFFEDAEFGSEPTFVFHRWSDRAMLACAADSGLYQVLVSPELTEVASFRSNLEKHYMDYARSCEPVAEAIAGARRVGKLFGIVRWLGFFREASGPGWVLVGDAGHFKDPTPGRGIADAFRQVDTLAPAIVAGLDGSGGGIDQAMSGWGRWRDEEFASHYWFAADLGGSGELPVVVPEIFRLLHTQDKLGLLFDIQNHRIKPDQVLTPPRMLRAATRLLLRRGTERARLVREVGTLVAEDLRRRRLNKRPVFAESSPTAEDAGPTEIEDAAAVTAA
jgi:2-polyprenyl-6-methoxyphenol hydroxylase-like FAD-dependent oxidoreductase